MKVYLDLPIENRGLQRVVDALIRYKPEGVEIVKKESEADLIIVHVYGRHDSIQRQVNYLQANRRRYAMVQYAIRSTMNPSTEDWIDMWQGAAVVWSYYYLPDLCEEDGVYDKFSFYYSPLGADSKVFYDKKAQAGHKACVIATCSPHALAESVKECVMAAKAVKRKVFHLGHDLRRGDDVFCKSGISDSELAYYYSTCEFVSGLRRVEGFELPAVEGLLCGARPILFDKPHYRTWYEGLANFIPEGTRQEVIESLTELFKKGATPVSPEEIAEARMRFDWNYITAGFWNKVLL